MFAQKCTYFEKVIFTFWLFRVIFGGKFFQKISDDFYLLQLCLKAFFDWTSKIAKIVNLLKNQ